MGVTERKSRERNKRREDILDAAEKIFAEKGILTSTIDDIAREAELGKGTLYNYFPSKEAILWYCAVRGMKKLTGMMVSSVSPENEPIINLRKMAESFMRFALRHNNYFRIFLTVGMGFSIPAGLTGNEVKEVFEKESPFLLIRGELKRGHDKGLFRSDLDIDLLTHAVWIQFYSFMQLISLNPEMVAAFGLNHEKLIETNMQMIINGIRKGGGV
ncbi:MAG: TetR/AcrR family transcriptional regulator [Bacteroidales bacterium]